MKDLIKVEGHKGLSRDAQSTAIVNTDRDALLAARKRKQEILDQQKEKAELEDRVSRLELLLQKLLGESDGDETNIQ